MKLKLLTTCMLGQHGAIIDMPEKERARQLIAKKVAEEFKPDTAEDEAAMEKKPAAPEKKTKGGKKPTEKIETK